MDNLEPILVYSIPLKDFTIKPAALLIALARFPLGPRTKIC